MGRVGEMTLDEARVKCRDDRAKALQTGVKLVHKYKQMADKLSEHAEEIDRNLQGYKFTDNINLIMDMLF